MNLEKHSLNTLSRRFAGLVSRNTIGRWILGGQLRPLMTDRTAAPYLFSRHELDELAKKLDAMHEARCRKHAKNEDHHRQLRAKSRADALTVLTKNEMAEFSGKPHLLRREGDPALSDADCLGATRLKNETPAGARMMNCSSDGKPWKEK